MCKCKEIDIIVVNQWSYGNADNLPFFFFPPQNPPLCKEGNKDIFYFPTANICLWFLYIFAWFYLRFNRIYHGEITLILSTTKEIESKLK